MGWKDLEGCTHGLIKLLSQDLAADQENHEESQDSPFPI
jgi:hypothetical protein